MITWTILSDSVRELERVSYQVFNLDTAYHRFFYTDDNKPRYDEEEQARKSRVYDNKGRNYILRMNGHDITPQSLSAREMYVVIGTLINMWSMKEWHAKLEPEGAPK